MRLLIYGVMLLMAAVPMAECVQAQDIGRVEETLSNAPFFYLARRGEITITVTVVGGARAGLYEVPADMSLLRLVALASSASTTDFESSTVRRDVSFALYKGSPAGQEVPVMESSLEELVHNRANAPRLEEGDVLLIKVRERSIFNWRDVLTIVTAAAAVILTLDRIFVR